MKILAISGSLRTKSSNILLLQAAARLAPEGMSVALYQGLGELPHFNPDLDSELLPEKVKELRALLAAVDGVLISSPEYAHGIPGSLKNALDWLVSDVAFAGKRVVLINSSAGDAAHLTAQLIEVLKTMSAQILFCASLRGAVVRKALDEQGNISDAEVAGTIRAGLTAFADNEK